VPGLTPELQRFHELHKQMSQEFVDNLNRNALADHPLSSTTLSQSASGVRLPVPISDTRC
jgi:hypothetical protein